MYLFLDVTYSYIVLQQPIGKKLFWCYCRSKPALKNLIDFIDLTVIRINYFLIISRSSTKLILMNQAMTLLPTYVTNI